MEAQKEYFMKLQALEYEANHLGEQLKVIEQQVVEMNGLKESVGKLENSGEQEIFSELGKGIFLKAKLKKSDLLVDVGDKILVPKTFKDVDKIVDEQIEKFEGVKGEISSRIRDINAELNGLIVEAQEKEGKKGTDKKKKEDGKKKGK